MLLTLLILVTVVLIIFPTFFYFLLNRRKHSFVKNNLIETIELNRQRNCSFEENLLDVFLRNEKLYHNFMMVTTFVVSIKQKQPSSGKNKGLIDVRRLKKALRKCQEKHPILRSGIEKKGTSTGKIKVFDDPEPIPFEIITRQNNDKNREPSGSGTDNSNASWWKNEMDKELSTALQVEKCYNQKIPLCRLKIVENLNPVDPDQIKNTPGNNQEKIFRASFIFSLHHGLFEGISTISFFHDLLTFYCEKSDSEVAALPFLPSSSQLLLIHFNVSLFLFMKLYFIFFYKKLKLIAGLKWSKLKHGDLLLQRLLQLQYSDKKNKSGKIVIKENHHQIPQNRRSKIFPINFSPDETRHITSTCKRRKLKVLGLATIASCYALLELLLEQKQQKSKSLRICLNHSVSTRNNCNIPSENIGLFAYSIKQSVPLKVDDQSFLNNKEQFWENVKFATADLHHSIEQKIPEMSHFLFEYVFGKLVNLEKFIDKGLKSLTINFGRSSGFGFSNRGLWKPGLTFINDEYICEQEEETQKINIDGCFFGASEILMGDLFFNSIVTINNRLTWTVIYCEPFVNEKFVEQYVKLIRKYMLTE